MLKYFGLHCPPLFLISRSTLDMEYPQVFYRVHAELGTKKYTHILVAFGFSDRGRLKNDVYKYFNGMR